jgi:ABC-type bacteriocin/lantibiotic exporter with double-glycine peptidase domain
MPALLSRELRWLLQQARPYRHLQLASVASITAGSWLSLLDPLVMKWLLDHALPGRDMQGLFLALFLMLSIYMGRTLLSSVGSFLTLKASQKMVLDLRTRLLRHLDTLSADYHEGQSVGARFYLFKEPMEEMAQLGADLLPSVLRTIVLTISIVVTMSSLNTHLTVAVLPLVPIFLVVKHRYRGRMQAQASRVQDGQSSIDGFLQEHLHSITQLQLLAAEKPQERRAFRLFAGMVRAQCRLWRTAAEFSAVSSTVTAVGIVTVLGIGAKEFFDGRLTLGGLVAFYTYLTRLFEPLSGAVALYSRLHRVGASIRKLMQAFSLVPSVKEHSRAVHLGKQARGALAFENVLFRYPGSDLVLDGVSFRVLSRSRVALVGTNGSGKSTTGKLLARLYDPCSGVVRIDGIDTRELKLKHLRQLVCYLPQHAVLFDASLRENLLFGNSSASEQDLSRALELAELKHIVSNLPGGLHGSVGPGGNQLSGGERQRIAIARAILQQPRALILDEATSFLDGGAEERILWGLSQQLCSTTIVMISHRLSALRWIDDIFVLKDGKIVANGTHMTLSQTSELYAELFRVRQPTLGTDLFTAPAGDFSG